MRAIVYTEYGPPEVLHMAEREKPVAGENEILIRVCAAEATKADCEMRSFRFPVKWFWLPLRLVLGVRRPKNPVLGGYFAGVIEAVGSEVTKFRVGERIFGSTRLRLGAYGEYICLPEDYTVVPMPENLSFEEAAAVPLGGLNALHFMRRAAIREGERVLINGAGGSIGSFAVQIARAMGAEVTAVDSAIKKQMLLDMGVDRFIDYAAEDFTRSGERCDVILDMVVKSAYGHCIASLKPGGRYLMGNPRISDMLRSVITSLFTDKAAVVALAAETVEELETLKEMIEVGRIRPVIDRVYPMQEAAEAHRRVEAEQRQGCVVISMAGE